MDLWTLLSGANEKQYQKYYRLKIDAFWSYALMFCHWL